MTAHLSQTPLVLGIDFGTDSVRALVVDTRSGNELGAGVAAYRRWAAGEFCDAGRQQFRQHPSDHLQAMTAAIRSALRAAGPGCAARVVGLGVDTTGSTPAPADAAGRPLALDPAFAEDPDAMFILWKDHTAIAEAERFNALAHGGDFTDYTAHVGGIYSSEWWWAKIARVLRTNRRVARAAVTWVEHCDWIPAELTGVDTATAIVRSRCAAGHKACWHTSWEGLPDARFLDAVQPGLGALRDRLYTTTATADQRVGGLSPGWAKKLGLPPGIAVASGAFDCHLGAVGAGAGPGILTKVIGTSTCDMLTVPAAAVGGRTIRGICGQVDGSIVPGLIGLEAGQSAFGDIYAWYRRLLLWPLRQDRRWAKAQQELLPALEAAAAALPPGAGGVTALDWHNGRRTPDADQRVRGAIAGLHLGSDAPAVYRALIESTACGSAAIVQRMIDEGIPVKGVLALGGIARKSPLVMQILADVMDRQIQVVASDQCCALGSAVMASVAAGAHRTVAQAQKAMASPVESTYRPLHAAAYRPVRAAYARLAAYAQGEAEEVR